MIKKIIDKLILYLYRKGRALDQEDIYSDYRKKYNIHPFARFNGPGTKIIGDGKFFLGEGSYIGMNSLLLPETGLEIRVGKNCSISHEFVVYTKNVQSDQDFSISKGSLKESSGSVVIEDDCWIGYRVFIKEGVRIGRNVVIGAHSVVTQDLAENCIYAGVPAKLIKRKTAPLQ